MFWRKKNKMNKLDYVQANDMPWTYDSPQNRMIVNAVMIVDEISLKELQDIVLIRMLPHHPRLKMHVSLTKKGRCYWEDDQGYDPVRHSYVDPKYKNVHVTKSILQTYMGEIYNRSFEDGHSPYEFILIPTYEKNQSAIIIRCHHVLADGMGLLGMLFSSADSVNDDKNKGGNRANKIAKQKPKNWKLFFSVPFFPLYWLKALIVTPDRNALHSTDLVLTGDRKVSWEALSLDDVKDVKNALGCSVNDVMLACLAGAFRNYLLETETKPSDVHVAVPISLRTSKEMANLQMYNKISVLRVGVPVSEQTPMERLKAVMKNMTKVKKSMEPVALYAVFFVMQSISMAVQKWAILRGATKSTSVLTNVPGPSTQVFYCGKAVHEIVCFVPSMGPVAVGGTLINNGITSFCVNGIS